MRQFGSEFYGSSEMQSSKANEEIVPDKVSFYKFSFMNSDDCQISINDSEPIFLPARTGFSSEQNDAMIGSFKILDDDIEYFWLGGS